MSKVYSFYDTKIEQYIDIGSNSESVEDLLKITGEWLLEDPATHAILKKDGINPELWLQSITMQDIHEWFPDYIVSINNLEEQQ